jgi:hypothetical protein
LKDVRGFDVLIPRFMLVVDASGAMVALEIITIEIVFKFTIDVSTYLLRLLLGFFRTSIQIWAGRLSDSDYYKVPHGSFYIVTIDFFLSIRWRPSTCNYLIYTCSTRASVTKSPVAESPQRPRQLQLHESDATTKQAAVDQLLVNVPACPYEPFADGLLELDSSCLNRSFPCDHDTGDPRQACAIISGHVLAHWPSKSIRTFEAEDDTDNFTITRWTRGTTRRGG